MNALTNFNTPFSTTLRVLNREGQPWFIAKDVCDALGLNTAGGVQKWIHHLTPGESVLGKQRDYSGLPNRGAWLVSESGFYKLVLKSRKPEAVKFQDWVTGVVLPAIRKDGGYILGEEKVVTGEMDEDILLARALQVAQLLDSLNDATQSALAWLN